ncbi:MAG TPA: hypothetical protein V6C97_31395 [Oculatellaceae cyanobacterium]
MPLCVHLTSEKNVRHISRVGIKATQTRSGMKGVFCMPILPNYYASHQWLRELRRGLRSNPTLIAIDFRLPSNELVLVGHFSEPHLEVTIGEASKLIMAVEDPMGYEILLPRSVTPKEIHKVRAVSQVIGWRYYPKAKGRPPCPCSFCNRAEFGGKKLRLRLGTEEDRYEADDEEDEEIGDQEQQESSCSEP